MKNNEREAWMAQLSAERKARREEQEEFISTIKALADRIQHPETRHIEAAAHVEPVVHEPPKDWAEMAQIGNEVPEFANVGAWDAIQAANQISEEKMHKEEEEIAKVGAIIPETGDQDG